ncbi:MAG: EAL domain-containing protein, partial [Peptococcaceae bacterium]|nr:EAL domain-containing protein [Peptococcaceae bacterium]
DNFSDSVIETIKKTGMDQANLELEITESVLLEKYALINEKLRKLQQNNIDIAIDDFGTGYSSLYRFDELNINTVKIDKSFIDKIPIKKPQQIITGDIIYIAHRYGINIVAEGVESPVQKEYLIKNDCDRIQGNLISKPLCEEEAIKLLRKQSLG